MATEIRELRLSNEKRIFVEVEIAENNSITAFAPQVKDLPAGAEPAGMLDDALIGMKLFQENITNMAESVYNSLTELKPDEWSVEMNIGFKGKATPIPFIATGEMEGGIKVTVTWKKEQ